MKGSVRIQMSFHMSDSKGSLDATQAGLWEPGRGAGHCGNHPLPLPLTRVMLRPTQLTQASFLQKNQMLQNGFLISVTLRWHSGVKNHEIWTFKVNFLSQKTSESF